MDIRNITQGCSETNNVLRIVHDDHKGKVYVEIEAKHDGVKMCSSVKLSRAQFAWLIRELGVMA
jgi:hypothetical protein